MEGLCSTGQNTQWAVEPMDEEQEDYIFVFYRFSGLLACLVLR